MGFWLLICLLNNGALTPNQQHTHMHAYMCVCVFVLHVLMHHKHFHLNNFHQRSGKLLATKWAVAVQAGASLCVRVCECVHWGETKQQQYWQSKMQET